MKKSLFRNKMFVLLHSQNDGTVPLREEREERDKGKKAEREKKSEKKFGG